MSSPAINIVSGIEGAVKTAIQAQFTADSITGIPIYISDTGADKAQPPFVVVEVLDCPELAPGCGIFQATMQITLLAHPKVQTASARDDAARAITETLYNGSAAAISETSGILCYGCVNLNTQIVHDPETKSIAHVFTWRVDFTPRD